MTGGPPETGKSKQTEGAAPSRETAGTAEITLEMMRGKLYSAVVCDALDALGYHHQSPRVELKPYTTDGLLVGRARTTLWADVAHEDPNPYELELRAVDACRDDDVLVAAAGGSVRSGIWGELLSTAARARGCVGAVVDGAIRDISKMREMGFPVFARGTSVYDSARRQKVIEMDVTVEIDGVRIVPGSLIFADVDGVVVVPLEIEREAVRAAWDKIHGENSVRRAIESGMKAADAYEKYGIL